MEDNSSRRQIDELADLYLTGLADSTADNPIDGPAPIRMGAKPAGGAPNPPKNPDVPAEPEDRHPVLRLTDSDTDEPQQTLAEAATVEAAGPRPGDAPEQTPEEHPIDEPAPKAALEAVILGNLPGMSGPWLTQYAQLIAQNEGPVAVLHVGEEAIDLELVEPRAEAEPAPAQPLSAVRIPPMRAGRTGLVGLLDALTRSEKTPTQTILVRLEATTTARDLSRLAAIDAWTVICGADDAAVTAATHTLKALANADPRLSDKDIGLMVMGSDEPAAQQATNRVAERIETFMSGPVSLVGHLKRMQPVQVREIGSFADPLGVWPQLVAWFDTLEAPEPRSAFEEQPDDDSITERGATTTAPREPVGPANKPAPQPSRADTPPTSTLQPQRLSPAAAELLSMPTPGSRPEPRPAFRPTPPRMMPAATTPEPQAPRQTPPQQQPQRPQPQPQTRRPEPAPRAAEVDADAAPPQSVPSQATRSTPVQTQATDSKPAAAPAPAAAQPTRPAPRPRVLAPRLELDLVGLLAQGPAALDEPAVLEARIPDQPQTQLAVDAEGVVHILARHQTDADAASPMDARQAVMQLIEAGRWVREHLELLALTQRDRDFIDHDPVLHLMTDRADLTTALVGKLAGQVKLHLLQEVRLGRESGWFCTPLG